MHIHRMTLLMTSVTLFKINVPFFALSKTNMVGGNMSRPRTLDPHEAYERNKTNARSYNKRKYWELRTKAFELLGNKCSKCNYADTRALLLEPQEAARISSLTTLERFKFVVANPTTHNFKLICHNCQLLTRAV